MESYLLKSSLCLLLLYVAYKLVLHHEANHQIKRMVGLVCIVFACSFLFIPLGFLTVPDTYPNLVNAVFMQGSEGFQEGVSRVITEDMTNVYLLIYGLGVVIFGLRSVYGLATLTRWYFTSKRSKKWGVRYG